MLIVRGRPSEVLHADGVLFHYRSLSSPDIELKVIELFYPPSDFQREIFKLIIQFAGALFIAWLTVRWALGRFKTERTWERQTKALADVLVALREMEFINNAWLDEELHRRSYVDDEDQAPDPRSEKHQAAHRQLREVAAIAAIVLPEEINAVIRQIETDLARDDHNTWQDQLDHDGAILKEARQQLLTLGRHINS